MLYYGVSVGEPKRAWVRFGRSGVSVGYRSDLFWVSVGNVFKFKQIKHLLYFQLVHHIPFAIYYTCGLSSQFSSLFIILAAQYYGILFNVMVYYASSNPSA